MKTQTVHDAPFEIGVFTLGDHMKDPQSQTLVTEKERIDEIIAMAQYAEELGLDVFGVGESHQRHFVASSNNVILGALTQATRTIKLISAATVLSTADPVRVYEEFSTLDLLSNGRIELVAGRASRLGAFDLYGFNVRDYEALFEEKIELLMKLNQEKIINWKGQFRPELKQAELFPKPLDQRLSIWRAVGGPPESAIKAGRQGLAMMLAILGGSSSSFKTTIDAYRHALSQSGHDPAHFPITTTGIGLIASSAEEAYETYFPYLNEGFLAIRGQTYDKRLFLAGKAAANALMVGDADLIAQKIVHQHHLYQHNRFILQYDFGGLPLDKQKETIRTLATEVKPRVIQMMKEKP